nr:delta(1)-pyrroline-2-carboxylate reductase family protein [Rhodoferax sp.]
MLHFSKDLVFDQIATAELLDTKLLVAAVARAAIESHDGLIQSPVRTVLPMGPVSGSLLSMPAVASDIGIHKLVSVQPTNAARGMATVQGLVTVFDAKTGNPLCILDGPEVTGRRTAAVSMLAMQFLLPEVPRTALLIGTGVQAAHHVKALRTMFPECRLHVKGRTPESSREFCRKNGAPNSELIPFDGTDFAIAQVVFTLTGSSTPVFTDVASSGQLLIAVGAYKPTMAEIEPKTVAGCRLYVDDFVGAQHEAGDLIQAKIDWRTVSPLSTVLEQQAHDHQRPILFKSVGCAAWDLAAARVALAQLK